MTEHATCASFGVSQAPVIVRCFCVGSLGADVPSVRPKRFLVKVSFGRLVGFVQCEAMLNCERVDIQW